jgi:glucose-1-phosphatase
MPPRFIYFDLGKVLLDFSLEQLCRQMGEACGLDAGRVKEIVFAGGLQSQYEIGQLSSRQFYDAFCRDSRTSPAYEALSRAGNEIFTLNYPMLPLVAHLNAAGYRLGILSNTCEGHWEYCLRRFSILRESFTVYALSYQLGVCKPAVEIFQRAAALAGIRPEEIFYIDDIAGHVEGARAAGFGAVLYTSAAQAAKDLRHRGVRMNM